jgi:ribosomal protein S18 acetylase RimI-like enzyme
MAKDTSSVRIRPAEKSDADLIVGLCEQFDRYLQELSQNVVLEERRLDSTIYKRDGFGENPAFRGLVAEEGGEAVGFLLYFFGYDSEFAFRTMHLLDLYVTEKHRARGVGREFMRHAKTICTESDAKEIVWSVYKPNRAARVFYEKLGAKIMDDADYMYIEVEKLNV